MCCLTWLIVIFLPRLIVSNVWYQYNNFCKTNEKNMNNIKGVVFANTKNFIKKYPILRKIVLDFKKIKNEIVDIINLKEMKYNHQYDVEYNKWNIKPWDISNYYEIEIIQEESQLEQIIKNHMICS